MNPTASLRALGFRLKKLRLGHTDVRLEKAAKAVSIAPSSLSRAENGKQALNPEIVRGLLDYYALTDVDERQNCVDLAKQGRKRGWWVKHTGLLNTVYLGLEDGAAGIWYLEPAMVPGLLQTRAYFSVLARDELPTATNDELEHRAHVRQERQAILSRTEDPCELRVILDEAVLRRTVGSPEIMAEQLDHILDMGRRPNITIQVRPFEEYGTVGLGARFTVLRFDDPTDPGTVYLEHVGYHDSLVDEPDEVLRFTEMFGAARATAASPSRSLGMIKVARDNYRKLGKE